MMFTVFVVVHRHPGWEDGDLDQHEIIGVFSNKEMADNAERMSESDKNCNRGGGWVYDL